MIVLIVVIAVFALLFMFSYNKLVQLRNRVKNAWAQIDVQLKRRADLIPNLVNTVKAYTKHEGETLERVIQARNAAISSSNTQERIEAENQLSGALSRIFALSESYPELKANANFERLQTQLEQTEDKISYMRQSYNDTVYLYNTATQQFPNSIVAGLFHFEQAEQYELLDPVTREAPLVNFD